MEYYWHLSFYYNMVVMALRAIEFIDANINCSFYVSHIVFWKLKCLKSVKYLFPFYRFQTVWSS
jgi:hypothetical protein